MDCGSVKVLVTGSDGFLGRHACEYWSHHDVTAVDVRSGVDAVEFFKTCDTGFDLVLHFAAIVGGRATIDGEPLAVAKTTSLDIAMFNWALRTMPRHVLYPSSSAAYPVILQGRTFHRRLAEDDISLLAPHLPDAMYGWVKLTGEHLAARAREQGLNVHVIRPMSGYGTDQDTSYPFGKFLERAKRGDDPFEIWGDGRQVRDWVHVDDIMATIDAMVVNNIQSPLNIGTGVATTFLDFAARMCEAFGYEPVFKPLPDKPTGVDWRVANTYLLDEVRKPRISLDEGIARAVKACR